MLQYLDFPVIIMLVAAAISLRVAFLHLAAPQYKRRLFAFYVGVGSGAVGIYSSRGIFCFNQGNEDTLG